MKKDGIVKGSFFLERKEDGKYFRIEVREENGDLIKAWEQNGADEDFASDVKEDGEYLVDLSKKQSGETPGEPTDPSEPTKPGESPEPPKPSNPEEKPTKPSVSPEVTPGENSEPTPEAGNPQETAGQYRGWNEHKEKQCRYSLSDSYQRNGKWKQKSDHYRYWF